MPHRNPLSRDNPRTRRTVVVTDAGTLGAIACIRSLGRVGYRVIACADDPEALGLRSRYAAKGLVHPPYADASNFLAWLDRMVSEHDPDLVIPSEGFLLAVRPQLANYAHLLTGADRPERLYRALSKYDVLQSFLASEDDALQAHLPETLLDDGSEPLATVVTRALRLGFPLYLKVDAQHARGVSPGRVVPVTDAAMLESELRHLRASHRSVTLQAHAPGVGVAAFALLDNGELRASFMHRRLHEVPHTGGVSAYRCSWTHPAIHADALRRLRHLEHQGAAMVEYRWDPQTDRFWFIEINARFWGSLHLALAAGVDFPRLLADHKLSLGRPRELPRWRPARMRQTVPLESAWLIGSLRDPALPWTLKLRRLAEFVLLGLDPRVQSDYMFPGDRALYWRALGRHLGLLATRALPRLQQGVQTWPQKP